MEIEFEWDERKAISNFNKHDVEFSYAANIFDDIFRIEIVDNRKNYGEIRYITIGEINSLIYVVVYTKRNGHYRIISARRANHEEKQNYYYET